MGKTTWPSNDKSKKYDFKTIKVRPDTFEKLVRVKAKIETEKGTLIPFNELINLLIKFFEKER